MKQRKLGIFSFLLVTILLLFSCAFAVELRGFEKGKGYQYISLGTYPYEADGTKKEVIWEILSVDNDQALLHSLYVLDVQQIIFVDNQNDIKNYNYRRISDYAESDMCPWMNNTMLPEIMGDDPMAGALIESDYGKLYILTDEQYLTTQYGFSASRWGENKSRQAYGTPYARKARGLYADGGDGTVSYWAAAVKSPTQYKMQLVGYNGHLSYGAYSRTNVGVRPAMMLDLTKCTVASGTGTKDDPFVMSYTGQNAEAAAMPSDLAGDDHTDKPNIFHENIEPDTSSKKELVTDKNETQSAAELPNQEEQPGGSLTLSFIGDCSIGDATQSRNVASSLTNVVKANGYDWLFSSVSDYLKNDDYTFANLEVTFKSNENGKSDKRYNLIAHPDHVQILLESGIDAVNTVNNHCMDFGPDGYRSTLKTLDDARINHFGTVYPGRDTGSDILGYATVNGVKIGMIGYSYPNENDLKIFSSRIQKLKEDGCALVVVSLHWGRETHMTSETWQYAFAKKLIDAGADVIWGHHPHVVQPVMFYKGKPIFFSTGNFVFGTMSQVDPSTGIFQLEYKIENGIPVLQEFRVIPCETTRGGDYRPRVLTDPGEIAKCLAKLVNKKNVKGLDILPEAFVQTGTVTVTESGELQ